MRKILSNTASMDNILLCWKHISFTVAIKLSIQVVVFLDTAVYS